MKPLDIIWDVSARSVAQDAHSMLDLWPWRNLSVGASGSSSCVGVETGVGHLENGLAEDVRTLSIDVLPVLAVLLDEATLLLWVEQFESADEVRDLRELRWKDREGRRYVGNTMGGSDGLRKSADIAAGWDGELWSNFATRPAVVGCLQFAT